MTEKCWRQHPIDGPEDLTLQGKCLRCTRNRTRRTRARSKGWDLCPAGHAFTIADGTLPDGSCRECMEYPVSGYDFEARYRPLLTAPGRPRAKVCRKGHDLTLPNSRSSDRSCRICRTEYGREYRRAAQARETAAVAPDTWLDWVQVWRVLNHLPDIRDLTKHEILCLICTVIDTGRAKTVGAVGAFLATTLGRPDLAGRVKYLWYHWAPESGVARISMDEAVLFENEPDDGLEVWFARQ